MKLLRFLIGILLTYWLLALCGCYRKPDITDQTSDYKVYQIECHKYILFTRGSNLKDYPISITVVHAASCDCKTGHQ